MRALIAALAITSIGLAQQPKLSGVWKPEGTAYTNLETSGAIAAPANRKLPYTAEAWKQVRKNQATRATEDPDAKCFQPGVPRGNLMPYPIQIVQNQRAVYVVYQRARAYRILYLDNAKHNDGLGFAMGDSRAHWEGETLVADVLSFGNQTWLDAAGHHHSDQLHVVERYTLTAPDAITYEARIEDPGVFTEPVEIRAILRRQKPGTELAEDECMEDATGKRHRVSPFTKAR